ncbi:MAG TPA: hypothetical protein P5572_16410 [Phycisphaerae bacterium]|nr:hypothetical protein [Phycisphaerae bacterium]
MSTQNGHLLQHRLLETAAMMVIGDSVLALVAPRRHVALWKDGPRWWERMAEPFIRNPNMTRALGAAGLGLGIWLAQRNEPTAAPARITSRARRHARRVLK